MTNKITLEKEDLGTLRWLNFANSFLDLARVGLLDYKKRKKVSILIPIIFCIKHGLEMWLKGLLLEWNGSFDKGHNQIELFDVFASTFLAHNTNLKERIEKLKIIIHKYHNNTIGGQKFNFKGDHMNDNFRYLVPGSKEYVKLNAVNIEEINEDIKEIFFCSTVIHMNLQVNKGPRNA